MQFTYNDFGQSIQTYQDHSGTVNTSTIPSVGMNYADGSNNTIRPRKLVYPNGRELNYSYGRVAVDNLSELVTLSELASPTDCPQ